MKVSKIYCDHCGKELDPERDFNNIEISNKITADLCFECLYKLYNLVCNFCEKKEQ